MRIAIFTFKNVLKIKGSVWGAQTSIFSVYSTSALIWIKNIFSKKMKIASLIFLPQILTTW